MSYEGMKRRIGVPTAAQYPPGGGIGRADIDCPPATRSITLEILEEIDNRTAELENVITIMGNRLSPIAFPFSNDPVVGQSEPLEAYPPMLDRLRGHSFAMKSLIHHINSILDGLGI